MTTETLMIHATYNDIRIPAQRLRLLLSNRFVSGEIIDQCELAVHELLTNLVDHAYGVDGSKTILVTLSWDGESIYIETRDTGKPANLDLTNATMPEPEELAEGGYSVAIIQALMDEVDYRCEHGTNILKLTRHAV